MMISLLDRHIGRAIFYATVLVLGVLLALFVFVVLVDALGDYGQGSFGFYELVKYVVLSQPRKLYELSPTALLIGTLLGLSSLALNSELTAMRAAGVSASRIVGAALKIGLVFVAAAVLLGEFVVPVSENQAQLGRARAMAVGLQQKSSGLWLRDGTSFVNVGEILPDLTLLRVNIFQFDGNAQLQRQVFAQRARYVGESWRLEGVRQSRVEQDRIQFRHLEHDRWRSSLSPEVVSVFAIKPEGLSLMHLRRYVSHLEKNSQDAGRYRLAFWQKLFLPLAMVSMVLLAIPFVFRQARSGGISQRIFLGIMLGLGFIVLNRSLGYFGLIYGLSPLVGALLPVLLVFASAFYLLRRMA
jgi:lipopolysaccharide export system permease protein